MPRYDRLLYKLPGVNFLPITVRAYSLHKTRIEKKNHFSRESRANCSWKDSRDGCMLSWRRGKMVACQDGKSISPGTSDWKLSTVVRGLVSHSESPISNQGVCHKLVDGPEE